MMISLFFARVLGVYFFIMGLFCLLRGDFIRKALNEFVNHPGLLVLAGGLNVFLGLVIIFLHPRWEWSWIVLITIIGYLTLLKGLLRLFVPTTYETLGLRSSRRKTLWIYGIIYLIVGIYLIYEGFFNIATFLA